MTAYPGCAGLARSPFVLTEHISSKIYIYIYVRHTLVARSWGYVMWEELSVSRALKMIFKGSGCFQFPEAVITSTAKESLRSTERGSIQVLAIL